MSSLRRCGREILFNCFLLFSSFSVPNVFAQNSNVITNVTIAGSRNRGFLQVEYMGSWHRVLFPWFSQEAGRMVCRQLGYQQLCSMKPQASRRLSPINQRPYLPFIIYCSDIRQSALETCNLQEESTLVPDDVLNQEVFFTCGDSQDLELQLANGRLPSEGMLQIRCNPMDDWSVFCAYPPQWDIRDGNVTCHNLGYAGVALMRNIHIPDDVSNHSILTGNIFCGGEEENLFDCLMNSGDKFDRFRFCDPKMHGVGWVTCTYDTLFQDEKIHLCGSHHTCTNRCGRWSDTRTCACDPLCGTFGDCCLDYNLLCRSNDTHNSADVTPFPKTVAPNEYSCLTLSINDQDLHFFMIATCPDTYVQEQIKDLCTTYAKTLILTLPTYDDTDGVVYKNIYCALCHGRKIDRLRQWEVYLRDDDNSFD